jgi:hypothetical protein
MTTGRNRRCHCGSGRKFKKCHGSASSHFAGDVLSKLAAIQKQEHERVTEFGHVNSIIAVDWSDHKWLAVGNRLFYSKNWKTFLDFLLYYIKSKIPQAWYEAQLLRELEFRHPVALWYWSLCDFQQRNRTFNAEGHFEGVPDGPSMAFVILAYDLYILEHHSSLQVVMLKRLLRDDSFQGARYELTVAATMIRAGFDLEMEDETDQSRKHPEFIAIHRKFGTRIAVEAKSKHRRGVLGYAAGKHPPSVESASPHKLAAEVCGLVEQALPKTQGLPIYVFVDLNLPADVAWAVAPKWGEEFSAILPQIDSGYDGNGFVVGYRLNLLIVTNFSHHYGEVSESKNDPLVYLHFPDHRGCMFPDASIFVDQVENALQQHGKIPKYFPTTREQ